MNISEKITLKSIQTLQPGDIIRDPELKGFGARKRSKNTLTYFVQTRINHQQRYFTIGTHTSPWTPDTARNRAKEILYAAKQGIDPNQHRNHDLELTFETVFQLYMAARGPHLKQSTAKENARIGKVDLIPYFKTKPFVTITREDVVKLHRSMANRPSAANHALQIARTVFYWAETEGLWPHHKNPCSRIHRYKGNSRASFLTVDDLSRLAEAFRWALTTGVAKPPQLSAILLMLFTGSRRGEIFTLQRKFIDRERLQAYLPDSKTGDKVVPLNRQALAILDGGPKVEGSPYYFPGRDPNKPITSVYKPWNKIRNRAQLRGFRLHDFRHSFASFAADGGATAQAVGKVLGHASVETTKIYLHLFNDRAKQTSQATADRLQAIITPNFPPNAASSTPARRLNLAFLRRRPFLPRQQPGAARS